MATTKVKRTGVKDSAVSTFIAHVKKVADIYLKPSKDQEVKETQATKLAKYITGMSSLCSSGKKDVAGLVSLLIGEPVRLVDKGAKYAGMFRVPERNTNRHSYKLNKAFLYTACDDYGLRQDGTVGNHIPLCDTRAATKKEIDDFITLLSLNLDGEENFEKSVAYKYIMKIPA